MAGKRGRAGEDLRTDSGRERTPGIKPGLLESLFSGGVAKGTAQADLRMGKNAARPGEGRMLWKGGPAGVPLATEDLRMDHDGEDGVLPKNMRMLAGGGEVDDGDGDEGGDHSAEEKLAAHEAMAAIKSGNAGAFLNAIKGLFMLLGG